MHGCVSYLCMIYSILYSYLTHSGAREYMCVCVCVCVCVWGGGHACMSTSMCMRECWVHVCSPICAYIRQSHVLCRI
jgi:hypothetical protein